VKIGNYEVSGVGDEEADEEIPGSCIWWGNLKFWSCQRILLFLQEWHSQFEESEREMIVICDTWPTKYKSTVSDFTKLPSRYVGLQLILCLHFTVYL
jgi:hypothetical protein